MGVIDGQPVDAATTNPAFLDQNQDDVAHGILGMDNAVPASGAVIGNVQGTLNQLKDGTGATEVTPGTVYTSQKRVTNGQNHPTAISNLDTAFHETTGHKHTGVAGDAPTLDGAAIGSVPLLGVYQQNSDLAAVTGTSLVVTPQMLGKVASTGPTVKGVVVTAPNNKIPLLNTASLNENESHTDSDGVTIYGRLTEAAGVWTLSFFKLVAGIETAHNFTVAVGIRWFYQELFARLVDALVYSDQLVQPNTKQVRSLFLIGDSASLFGDVQIEAGSGINIVRTGQKYTIDTVPGAGADEATKVINFGMSPYTLLSTDKDLFVDCTGGPVIINGYVVGPDLGRRIRMKKTDVSANSVTFNRGGADTIDGLTSYVLSNQYEAVTFITFTNLWAIFA